MESVISANKISIRLPKERWLHIMDSHDDLAGRKEEMLNIYNVTNYIFYEERNYMEKADINNIQSIVPNIIALSQKKRRFSFDYDKDADVLYISFQKPQQATDTEMINDDILLRKRKNEIVGITVLHASSFGK